jgi:hypothetical protein
MGLDINTPKGQKTVKEEIKMLKYVSKCFNVKIKITKKDKPFPHDGIISNPETNKIIGVFESKNRQITLQELEDWGSWLITYEKLEKCRQVAKKYNVPLYGFLGIEKNNLVMYWKITDSEGNYLFEFDHYNTITQSTVNGGEAYRDNAFLPIEKGKFVQPNKNLI